MVNILVVDDEVDMEPMIRQRFRRAVRAGKVNLYFARDGAQALEIVEATPEIELIIIDLNMPGMDGLTFLEQLAVRSELAPVTIIVSAYGDLANIRAGMNRGAFDFLTKPIAFDDLERTIKRALKKGHTERLARTAHARVLEMQREFDWARRVQMGILPLPWARGGAEHLVGFMRPAREVGGDAYDFIRIDEDHVGMVIADVVGKGMAAAMVAVVTRALMRAVASQVLDPSACMAKLNTLLTINNPEMLYVTLFYCVLDRRGGVVSYANAGHPWPLKLGADGSVAPLAGMIGIPLGIRDNAAWTTGKVTLKPGERLFFFTDGLTEATNEYDDLFGEARLRDRLQALGSEASDDLIKQLIAEIDEFAGSDSQSDDMTCLMLDWRGRDAVATPDPMLTIKMI